MSILKKVTILGLGLALFACDSSDQNENPDIGEEPSNQEQTFTGEIIEVNESEEGDHHGVVDAENIGHVLVDLPSDIDWQVGDNVEVIYDGTLMESHPVQINQINIEKIDGE